MKLFFWFQLLSGYADFRGSLFAFHVAYFSTRCVLSRANLRSNGGNNLLGPVGIHILVVAGTNPCKPDAKPPNARKVQEGRALRQLVASIALQIPLSVLFGGTGFRRRSGAVVQRSCVAGVAQLNQLAAAIL